MNKSINLKIAWDRAVMARKVELGSPLVLQPVTVKSDAQPQNPIHPSVVLVTILRVKFIMKAFHLLSVRYQPEKW